MARTIVLGYDGSECAKEALDVAVAFACDAPGSRIVVVNGQPVHLNIGGGIPAAPEELVVGELDEFKGRTAAVVKPVLEEAARRIAAAGVPVEWKLEWTGPSDALLEAAAEMKADMIVVGSHGHGAVAGRLLGSTPFRLLHHSSIPVVVVPHRE